MLYLIGLGLNDPTDIGAKGKLIIKKCDQVYLEAYTSILHHGAKDILEKFHGCTIEEADREKVEMCSEELLSAAQSGNVALLVAGDPLGATTHTDLMLRAKQASVPVTIISNSSILTAVGIAGLDVARFGEVVSIPFWEETWKPDSYADKIAKNLSCGLHTLCLLDIKVKEQSIENIIKNRKIFEPARYMRTHQGAEQLLQIVNSRQLLIDSYASVDAEPDAEKFLLKPDTFCVGCARLGTPEQRNFVTSLKGASEQDLGSPLHSLVVCAPFRFSERSNAIILGDHFTGTAPTTPDDSSSNTGRLHLVGLGLAPDDFTIKGLNALKKCPVILMDERTRKILKGINIGIDLFKEISELLDAEDLARLQALFAQESDGFRINDSAEVFKKLQSGTDVAIVVWGDPLVYTRYNDLLCRAIGYNISFNVIHNASVLNSIACCGLQLYTFGETVQFPDYEIDLRDDKCRMRLEDEYSFLNKIIRNKRNGWHTLCLLHCVEEDCDSKFITPTKAACMLLKTLALVPTDSALTADSLVVGIAGFGSRERELKTSTLAKLSKVTFTAGPVYALIVVGQMHPLEEDCLSVLTERL